MRQTAGFLGAQTLDVARLRTDVGKPDASTLYILGSGSSVEKLSTLDFKHIGGQCSIGINAWPLHDFVPDAFAFEPVPRRDSDHFHTMSLLAREDIVRKQPLVLFLKPRDQVEIEQFFQVPLELRGRVRMYGRVQPLTRRLRNLGVDLRLLFAHLRRSVHPIAIDSGASILRLCYIGMLAGFARIVFVGVDLNTTQYFWEKNPTYLEKRGLEKFSSGQVGGVHETLNPDNRPFVVTDMVGALSGIAGDRGIELSVASETSELAGTIKVHRFGEP